MAFDFELETNNVCINKKVKWTIKNVWQSPPCLQSPKFLLILDSEWFIQLNHRYSDSFKCFIRSYEIKDFGIILEMEGKLVFINPSTSKFVEENFKANFNYKNLCAEITIKMPFQDFLRSKLELKSDVLFVEFHMKTVAPIYKTIFCRNDDLEEIASSFHKEGSNILANIYKDNVFTDVVFNFGKEKLKAHKVILSETSPVFKKMFEHDTLESQNNSVSIEDVDIDVFHGLLEFLYTRTIKKSIKSDLDSMLALYEVSDKYEVGELQKICANILLSQFLNVNSVCKILIKADLHSDKSMKGDLFKFLKEMFPEVAKTEEWSSLTTENVKLASEVVAFITTQLN